MSCNAGVNGGGTSYVGMIIFSITLDTEAKVKSTYGGNQWTQIQNRFLIGASSSYPNGSTGGSSSHRHVASLDSSQNYAIYGLNKGVYTSTESHIPPYRAVYIWERTQ